MYPRLCEQPMCVEDLLCGELEKTNEPYAVAKIAGWKLCESYNKQYGTKYSTVIPANLYGPHDNFHPTNSHVVPALMSRIHQAHVNKEKSVTIWGSGNIYREFLYVDDLIDACNYIENNNDFVGPINIGSSQEVTIKELAETLKDVVGYTGKLTYDLNKPEGMPFKKVNSQYLDKLGWKSKTSLYEGLNNTYSWYLKQFELPMKEQKYEYDVVSNSKD